MAAHLLSNTGSASGSADIGAELAAIRQRQAFLAAALEQRTVGAATRHHLVDHEARAAQPRQQGFVAEQCRSGSRLAEVEHGQVELFGKQRWPRPFDQATKRLRGADAREVAAGAQIVRLLPTPPSAAGVGLPQLVVDDGGVAGLVALGHVRFWGVAGTACHAPRQRMLANDRAD